MATVFMHDGWTMASTLFTASRKTSMRRTTLRKRPDGLLEVTRVGRLHRAAVALAVALLALPLLVMLVLVLVAVFPALVFVIPAAIFCACMLALSRQDGVRRPGTVGLGQVVPLHTETIGPVRPAPPCR
jgi:hypothetical protein